MVVDGLGWGEEEGEGLTISNLGDRRDVGRGCSEFKCHPIAMREPK